MAKEGFAAKVSDAGISKNKYADTGAGPPETRIDLLPESSFIIAERVRMCTSCAVHLYQVHALLKEMPHAHCLEYRPTICHVCHVRGEKKEGLYTPGVDLRARVTLLAEGARGS
eukprot:scaffold5038_cov23-Tisochrysis_lutea.AAC.1